MKNLPLLRDLVICREASSHDRRGGNDNGFSNKAEWVRRGRGARTVIFDAAGPGCVKSFWYSWPDHPLLPRLVERAWAWGVGEVAFRFDGEKTPRLSVPLRELVGTPPFTYPLALDAKESAGGYVSYVPMPFEDGLIIEVGGGRLPLFFHHLWYHAYPLGTRVEYQAGGEADLSNPDGEWSPERGDEAAGSAGLLKREIENLTLPPRSSREVMRSDKGGVIGCVRMELPEDDEALRAVRLRAWWDDDDSPSVDAPLSLLFALENRFLEEPAAIVDSAESSGPVIGRDREGRYYFKLPMPYSRRARLSLENRGDRSVEIGRIGIEYGEKELPGLGRSAGYLRTQHRESRELTPGGDYVLARLEGRGKIVGVVLSVADAPETFLEGDERIYTDGCRSPLVMGDATETYFNGSWYFGERAFACPLHGAPVFRMKKRTPGSESRITMYRFHLTDFVPYRAGARFQVQHGPFNDVEGNYRSLVFYYGLAEKSLRRTDFIRMSDDRDREAHAYGGAAALRSEERDGFFEGERNGQDLGLRKRPARVSPMLWNIWLTARGIFHDPPGDSPDRVSFTACEHDAPYEFTVKVDPENEAVMVRRLFNQDVPDQRARVEVDGETAGIWQNAGRNKWKIWAEDDLILKP